MSRFSAARVKNQSHEPAFPVVVERIEIGNADSFSSEDGKRSAPPWIRASIAKTSRTDVSREFQKSACWDLIQKMLGDVSNLEFLPAAKMDWALIKSETGAPRLVHRGVRSDIHISLAHSGPWIAVALARGARVGIDVEQKKPRDKFIAMAEYMGWEDSVDDLHGFLSRWTLWEACVKLEESSIFSTSNAAFDALCKVRNDADLFESGQWAALNRHLPEDVFFALAIHQACPQPLKARG